MNNVESWINVVNKNSEKKIKKGMNMLKSKFSQRNTKYKTRLCISCIKNIPCPHGEFCRFAHNKSELENNVCFFGKSCRFVCFSEKNNEWINTNNKKCLFIHPTETQQNFVKRCNTEFRICSFAYKCKFVFYSEKHKEWFNTDNKKCLCYHPNETIENYNKRMQHKTIIKKSGIILCDNNKILLVKNRRTNLWGFPKGSVENFDKNLKYAAIRELKEETGYILDYKNVEKGWLVFKDFILFNANIKNIIKKVDRTDTDEIITQEFLTFQDIKYMDRKKIDGSLYKFIKKYL